MTGATEARASAYRSCLPVLAHAPDARHGDRRALDFIAHFVVPNQKTANLARLELLQLFATTGWSNMRAGHVGARKVVHEAARVRTLACLANTLLYFFSNYSIIDDKTQLVQ